MSEQFHLYEKEVLAFHLSPHAPGWYGLQDDWISALSAANARWDLTFEDLTQGNFRFLPYQSHRGIDIDIEPPHKSTLGGLILLWTKVRDLVDILSQVNELPNIEIRLRENECRDAKWPEVGKLQRSFPFRSDGSDKIGMLQTLK